MPTLHLLAGPDGAGKATLYRSLVAARYPALVCVDSDAQRMACVESGESFVTATSFSHPSKLELLARARERGYAVVLYIVCLDDIGTLLRRVKQGEHEGGPHVPAHKVVTRYARTLGLLQEALGLADLALLFDGIDVQAGGPRLVASITAERMHLHVPFRPRWVEKLLGFAEG